MMAEAALGGACKVRSAEVRIYQVPETLPEEILSQMGTV